MSWKKKFVRNWGRLGMKCKLSDICDFRKGKVDVSKLTLKTYISTENMLPNKGGITEASSLPTIQLTQEYKKGDVLVSNIRPYFKKIWRAKYDGGCSNDVLVFQGNSNIDGDFLYYVLANDDFFDYSMATSKGTKMPRGDKTSIMQYEVPVFDVYTQRKMASVLRCLDEKIELNFAINNNLEQQAQAIFQSWFIDFEPFGYSMPADWETATLDTIADFQNGYAFKSKELLNEPAKDTYQVFKQGHINRGGGFLPDGTKSWYPKSSATNLNKFVLKKGDILMAMTDMKDNVAILGNTAIMPLDDEFIVNQRVGHLRANGYKGITYPYIYLLTNSKDFLTDLRSRANSGVQVNLSSTAIKSSKTVIATEDINIRFSAIVMPMFEQIIQNQLENQRLSILRDTLLPKLMSGELDVSNIDI